MAQKTDFVDYGIDVSKNELVIGTVIRGEVERFLNGKEGHLQLIEWLSGREGNPRVSLEATGGYELPVLHALYEAGITACRVHARHVHYFIRSEGQQAKTDPIDAYYLARYGAEKQPKVWIAPQPSDQQLRELLQRMNQLTELIAVEKNHLESATGVMIAHNHRVLALLESEHQSLQKRLLKHLEKAPQLKQLFERFVQVQGVGKITALTVLALLPEIGTLADKTIAALVGLAPFNDDSGKHQGKRRIQYGRSAIRKPLYMAAVSATRCNPILAAFYKRLRQNGKPPKLALVAVMRKLITLLNRIAADPDFCPVS